MSVVGASHGNDDFSWGVTSFQIPEGLRGFAQRVRPVDDRPDLSGFDEFPQKHKVRMVRHRNKEASLLAHEY